MADTHHNHGHRDLHHDHQHLHEHTHGSEMSFTERNRAHWDKQAATYMSDDFQKEFGDLLNKVTAFILSNIPWIGVNFLDPASGFEQPTTKPDRTVRILDYACGPGTITIALAGYASEYVGIDLSPKMVEEYNRRLSSPAHESGDDSNHNSAETRRLNAHATVGNLLDAQGPPEALSGPEFTNFDLVAVGLGFHHFENLDEVTRRLVERVKPGGIFMIVDFLPHEENDLGDLDKVRMVAHHGFTPDRVRKLFAGAGLADVDLKVMSESVMLRGKAARSVFLARGRKPQ